MSESLPSSGFEWVAESEYNKTLYKLEMNQQNESTGYFLEVDLKFPEDKHHYYKDFPLCPEHIKPPCARHLATGNSNDCVECKRKNVKLINHCWLHYNYVIDSSYLKIALAQGVKVIYIHKVLKYNQSPWMKNYIDFNTKKRNGAKNDFEKDLFKLANNSVYGGTLLQAEKFVNFELINNKKKYKNKHRFPSKITNEHSINDCWFCNPSKTPQGEEIPNKCECMVGMELRRQTCTITRPVYVGVKILESSKAIMADIWYTYKNYFGPRIELAYSDTDSFISQIQSEDIQKEFFKQFEDTLDLSNCDFPMSIPGKACAAKHPLEGLDLNKNKKVLGKMKNEVPPYPFFARNDEGDIINTITVIEEVEALRSKCYSIKLNYHAYADVKPVFEEHDQFF